MATKLFVQESLLINGKPLVGNHSRQKSSGARKKKEVLLHMTKEPQLFHR